MVALTGAEFIGFRLSAPQGRSPINVVAYCTWVGAGGPGQNCVRVAGGGKADGSKAIVGIIFEA